jgi:hypothetical protein
MSDTVRISGFEHEVAVVNAITPVAYTTSSTPISSSAIDTRSYPRARILVIWQLASDSGGDGVLPGIVEGATSSPTADASGSLSGTFAIVDGAAAAQYASYRRNPAKPFIKVNLTPDGGSGVVSAVVLFIYDGI